MHTVVQVTFKVANFEYLASPVGEVCHPSFILDMTYVYTTFEDYLQSLH